MPFEFERLSKTDQAAICESLAANVADDPRASAWNGVMAFLQFHPKGNLLAFVLSAYLRNTRTVNTLAQLIEPDIVLVPMRGPICSELLGVKASFGSTQFNVHTENIRRDYLFGSKKIMHDIELYFAKWNGLILGQDLSDPEAIENPAGKVV